MNKKLLRFQNRKLAERIEVRRRVEADLRNRIDQLETRLTTGRYCARDLSNMGLNCYMHFVYIVLFLFI